MTPELETMRPNPVWDPAAHEDAVEAFAALRDELDVTVWCGDWCTDCRALLPDFAAGIAAAGVPEDRIHVNPVEKADDGRKVGPNVEEYGVEKIPTVVIERDGEVLARFVEDAPVPILVHLAEQLQGPSGTNDRPGTGLDWTGH